MKLASCIMVTRDRPEYAAQSIAQFKAQDYNPRELIVLDNGHKPIEHLCGGDARIHYLRELPDTHVLGQLRNLAIEHSSGDYTLEWDDDDWRGAEYTSALVQGLEANPGAWYSGMSKRIRVLFVEERKYYLWPYSLIHDGSLCIDRRHWFPFTAVPLAEKNTFTGKDGQDSHGVGVDRPDLWVYRVHQDDVPNIWASHMTLKSLVDMPADLLRLPGPAL